MSLTLDFIQDDWRVIDGRRAVRYTSVRNNGPLVDVIEDAHPRQLTRREQAVSGGVYTNGQLLWNIPALQMRIGPPKEGDVITDGDGQDWTVLSHAYSAERAWWDLTCINLAIAYDLRDAIDIQRAGLVYDAGGLAVKTFPPDAGSTLYTSLTCRVQEISREEKEERGLMGTSTAYRIYLGRQTPDVGTEDRVVWSRLVGTNRVTTYLERLKYTSPDSIAELPQLECELTL